MDRSGSLYVGNLRPECTEAVLFEKFSGVGPLLSVRICRDVETGNSLGYGYVNYSSPEDAITALDTLNYDTLNGQPIRIMWAQKNLKAKLPKRANLVVKNLHKDIDDRCLRDIFSNHGQVMSVKIVTDFNGDSKGFGFVQFESEESAEDALASIHGSIINGQKVAVSRFIPYEERKQFQEKMQSNNVFVNNLNSSFTCENLVDLCSQFGPITSARVATSGGNYSKGFGFVCFETQDNANRAVAVLNETYLDGRHLSASIARKFPEDALRNNEIRFSPEYQY